MSGPDDKWDKVKISTTSDSNALTSDQVLTGLNTNYPITSSFVAVCSDGTFLFVGWYS